MPAQLLFKDKYIYANGAIREMVIYEPDTEGQLAYERTDHDIEIVITIDVAEVRTALCVAARPSCRKIKAIHFNGYEVVLHLEFEVLAKCQ